MSSSRCKVNHLIIDSAAFIRGSPLHEIGEKLYTIPEVLAEIKDKATRERIAALPYEIQFREPSAEDIKWITLFSKKTGDFHSLSVVDIKLLALTLMLEKQHVGHDHLKKEPNQVKVVTRQSNHVVRTGPTLNGFYCPPEEIASNQENQSQTEERQASRDESDEDVTDELPEEAQREKQEDKEPDEDDDENDKSWITPKNVDEIKERLSGIKIDDQKEEESIAVACITSDFAMQNMLLQIGLKVVSVDKGLVVRQTKQFILRCYACFKTTANLGKKFCPHCGNLDTLKRVSYRINDQGEKVIHINPSKPINIRGKRYSLPMPKSGKHANNPILVEDQPLPQNKASKFALAEKAAKTKMLNDPDYILRSTPFAVNDVYSKASRFQTGRSHLGVERRRNPNEVRKSTGNRKRNN